MYKAPPSLKDKKILKGLFAEPTHSLKAIPAFIIGICTLIISLTVELPSKNIFVIGLFGAVVFIFIGICEFLPKSWRILAGIIRIISFVLIFIGLIVLFMFLLK